MVFELRTVTSRAFGIDGFLVNKSSENAAASHIHSKSSPLTILAM
jgi:hypothetical protein